MPAIGAVLGLGFGCCRSQIAFDVSNQVTTAPSIARPNPPPVGTQLVTAVSVQHVSLTICLAEHCSWNVCMLAVNTSTLERVWKSCAGTPKLGFGIPDTVWASVDRVGKRGPCRPSAQGRLTSEYLLPLVGWPPSILLSSAFRSDVQ